jgi:enoyl-CoA hydratase/carnithine racemase
MSYEYVNYEKKGHIAYVTINSPEVMNALHYDTNVELSAAFDDFKQDEESWVAIRRRSELPLDDDLGQASGQIIFNFK